MRKHWPSAREESGSNGHSPSWRFTGAAQYDIPVSAAILALNLAICWRLFKVEFTDHFGSIEGAFIGLARYVSRHWGDFSWWPIWHCGMPFADTYVPLLHLVVAAVASLLHISAGRAYHGVVGTAYALGPVALYWMAVRLGAPRGASLAGALVYSLFSPAALVMPEVARDIGGYWGARRFQVLTVYGEGPHVSSMTLLPLAILALEGLLARRTGRSLAWAAAAIALVFLSNVPGTMALGLAVYCWICAQRAERLRAAWVCAAGAAVLAYALACYGLPPSSLRTVFGNVGAMHSGFSNSLRYGPLPLMAVLGALAAAGYGMARTRMPLALRFAVLLFALLAGLAGTARFETYELLPQVGRLQLEMEMGASLLLGIGFWAVHRRSPRWLQVVMLGLCAYGVITQFRHYRGVARAEVRNVDLATRSEYTSARWLDANAKGQRVYVAGSTGFWLNAFTDTPQLGGCCEQGQSMKVLKYAPYVINAGIDARETALGAAYLRALGVGAVVANGPESTDEYHDIKAPERFEKVFPVLHKERGDTIYAVPGSGSLAHVVRAEELVRAPGKERVDEGEVKRYAAAAGDAARSQAELEWVRGGAARIRANLHREDLISVQVAWFPGWKASVRGAGIPVTPDGLGFLVLSPSCEGRCEIDLRWGGRWDMPFAAGVSVLALASLSRLVSRDTMLQWLQPPRKK